MRVNRDGGPASKGSSALLVDDVLTTTGHPGAGSPIPSSGSDHVVTTIAATRERGIPVGAVPTTEISGRFPEGIPGLTGMYSYSVYRLTRSWSNVHRMSPKSRRFNGGIGRRHRCTVGATGEFGLQPETGVVRRLRGPCAGHNRAN